MASDPPPPPLSLPSALTRDDLAAVLAPLASARPLPRAAYRDPRLFRTELELFFARGWFAAGSEADLVRPGAWERVALPETNLVLARAADLTLRALHDVCTHRATLLLEGDRGHLPSLELACPYHGWTYDLRGALRRAPGMPAGFDLAAHGLRCARLATRHGQVFATRDPGTMSFDDAMGTGVPWLNALDEVPLRRARRVEWEVAANWKLLVENFQESHHFPSVHPELEKLSAFRDSASVLTDGRWLGGVMDLAGDAETVSRSARVGTRRYITPEGERRAVRDALLFPNLLTSLQPDYLLTYRLTPRAPDRTLVVAETYLHAASPDRDDALSDLFVFWDRVNAQDRAICERQQRGLDDAAWRPGVYAPSEDGVHAFDGLWARALLAGTELLREVAP